VAAAQPRVLPHPLPKPAVEPAPQAAASESGPGLQARLGTDRVQRLLRSGSDDDVLRGIERLASIDSPDSYALLVRAASSSPGAAADAVSGCARRNPRALLRAVRALAHYVDRDAARKALREIIDAPLQQLDSGAAAPSDGETPQGRAARVMLARQEAAMALAASGSTAAQEMLVDVARREGPGESSAVAALAAYPPRSPAVLGGVALTTRSTVSLAAAIGDLRTLDAVLGALKASDPSLRAAALTALGNAGDGRVLEGARAAAHDPDARVRAAAAEALVRLGAGEAPAAVVALVADDATTLDGLRLAAQVQGEGVTSAAAARAAASADRAIREAAVEALGSQSSPAAVKALLQLGRAPGLRSSVAAALARSPSAAALAAIESMATPPQDGRVAARAYFVRRFVHGERSHALDALLKRLASSADPVDRAVGAQARIALKELPVDAGLRDPDARVRAAAAMGAAADLNPAVSNLLLARLAVETDMAASSALALGLVHGDDRAAVATSRLVERSRSGAADGPLAALALARRSADVVDPDVVALLESSDPVMRAHTARGLGSSRARGAAGILGRAYEFEVDAPVRRAIVAALAARSEHLGRAGEDALVTAAQVDPDRIVRETAEAALRHATPPLRGQVPEVAWVSLVPADEAALPRAVTAAVVDSDGLAWPIAFDDDGFALEPGVPAGGCQLRLAPRLPPY
jgi:HEAT repeat protein